MLAWHFIEWVYRNFLHHYSIGGHLNYFQTCIAMNNHAINILVISHEPETNCLITIALKYDFISVRHHFPP